MTTPPNPNGTAAPPELLSMSESFWESEALPVLSQYVTIPCLSPEFDSTWEQRGAIEQAVELLAGWARGRSIDGLRVEVVRLPGLTPVIIADIPASPGRPDGPPTLCYGHLDKQPPLGDWRSGLSPFEPVREDDLLYGRGTADDGYSIFAALGAIELAEQAGIGHGRCVVIIEASEESGSPHLGPYLSALSNRLGPGGPGLVVCLDSGATTYDRLWYTTSLRGLVLANLRVDVLTEGAHSGVAGGIVPDSFRLLRSLLGRIEDDATGEILLESCSVEIPAARRAEAEALASEMASGGEEDDGLATVAGLRLANGAGASERMLAGTWSAALALVGVEGIPAIADAGNVLRPYTAVKLAMRIPPSADSLAVAEELQERLRADPPDGATVCVSDVVPANGFNAPESAPWLSEAADAASVAYFGARSGGMGEGGTIPFLSELLAGYPKAQFLVTGVLGPGSNAHGVNESLHVPTAKRLTASVAHVLSATP